MESEECVQQIECDIHRFPVAKAPRSGHELIEWLSFDELGDQIPVAEAGPVSPEALHHVAMMDLSQGADLAAHRLIAGSVVEELERSLLTFDIVAHPIDLRETAVAEYAENVEGALDHLADSVFSRLGA